MRIFNWIVALAVGLLAMTVSNAALAACANPTGVEGEFIYNNDHDILQFCDGTDWIGMSGGTSGGGAGVTDGDKGDVTVSGSGASWMIDDDVLDFTEFSDAMTLDASTTITITGSNTLSLINTGTGDSFVVNDQASDTTPFVIAADGKVGIGLAVPTQALDVVGTVTPNSLLMKKVAGAAAPTGGGGSSGQWTTDGTHVWRATGSVGIGTAAPGATLEVVRDGNSSLLIKAFGDSSIGSALNFHRADGTATSPSNVKSGFTIGNLTWAGQGATGMLSASAAKITVSAAEDWSDSTGAAMMRFFTRETGTTGASTERMRITSEGKVGIGTTDPTAALDVNGSIVAGPMGPNGSTSNTTAGVHLSPQGYGWFARNTTNGVIYLQQLVAGTANFIRFYSESTQVGSITTNGTTTTYATTSDRRLKEGIANTTTGLEKVMQIEVKDFSFKNDASKNRVQGFIAQDLYRVYPEAVSKGDDGDAVTQQWGVEYGRVTPLLVKAIQELKAANDNLRVEHDAELKALRTEIEALKAAQ